MRQVMLANMSFRNATRRTGVQARDKNIAGRNTMYSPVGSDLVTSKLFPSFSKYLWFQCQAFPKNVLAVLWDFKGLQ
jgi:hypothetical protein